jgi:hypothetical protein
VSQDWHVACELEVLQRELAKGNRVTVIVPHWSHALADTVAPCYVAEDIELEQMSYLMKCRDGYGLLLKNRNFIKSALYSKRLKVIEAEEIDFPADFLEWLEKLPDRVSSLSELSEERFDDFEIGSAAVSSFVSWTRMIDVNVLEEWGRIQPLLRCAYAHYLYTIRAIDEYQPDTILTFNGRFASSRGIYSVAKSRNIECWLHERGSEKNKFEVFKNYLPHSQCYFHERVSRFLDNKPKEFVDKAAESFYLGRRKGIEQAWVSFTSAQKADTLPDGWDENQHNIVIFNSSEDEFVSIGEEWKNPIYGSQCEGVDKILRDYDDENSHFWLRMHPNLGDVPVAELEEWYELGRKYSNLTVIAPSSEISSYALVDSASVVLTFGSTMGAEATYWGKPSIMAGSCFYKGTGVSYDASSHENVVELLKDRNLKALGKEGAKRYGAFCISFGEPFKYADAIDFNVITFKKRSISSVDKFKEQAAFKLAELATAELRS